MRWYGTGTGINFPPSAVEGQNWMKHALKKLMGDCVAGIFLPPMWREETEHTTALYNSMHMLPNTLLNVLPAAYNCQPVNVNTWQNIELYRLLNCCFLRFVALVLCTAYYWSYSGINTWQNIELLLSTITSTCTTYYQNYGIISVHEYTCTLNIELACTAYISNTSIH